MLLGAQTYTIRAYTQNERDFREAMRRVAAIGYKSVQLSAIGAIDPHVLREICDENGLQIVLTHTNPDRMLTDPDAVIRDHEILGCDYIGVGAMADRYRNSGWVERFAKDFEVPAKKMQMCIRDSYGDCVPFFKRLDEIFAAPQIILTWRDNRSSVTAEREKYTASENVTFTD